MIFNEFRLIGTVVSDFEEKGSANFHKYEFYVEVEKKSKGKAVSYPVVVYHTNKEVDVTKSLRGKTVIVGGYIDIYNNFMSLVVQDVTVIGTAEPKVVEEIKPEDDFDLGALESAEEKGGIQSIDRDDVSKMSIPDDDLPF